jgi:hypothetical protein
MAEEKAQDIPPEKLVDERGSDAKMRARQAYAPSVMRGVTWSARDAVIAEEILWARLARLKDSGDSLEKRRDLRETYSDLAEHYAAFGGTEAAIRFIQNALEQSDDPKLRRRLAFFQGTADGFDFISSFTTLLDDKYDLRLTLQFCYFLEKRGLHQAALDILKSELKKRPNQPEPFDSSEANAIDRFYALLQANITFEQQVCLHDYQQIVATSFPEQTVLSLRFANAPPQETIAGKELEEFQSEYGLKDEITSAQKLIAFFVAHYGFRVSVVITTLLLPALMISPVPPVGVKIIAYSIASLQLFFLLVELLRSLRLPVGMRLRAHTKLCENVVFAFLEMIILNWIGLNFFSGSRIGFFSSPGVNLLSLMVVAAVFYRTYLAMAVIRKSLRKIPAHLLSSLDRRAYRRQLAGLVLGTAPYAFFIDPILFLSNLTSMLPFLVVQLMFLAVCWRWSYLERRAEKRRLRDQLIVISLILFAALIAIELNLEVTPWQIILNLSLDGGILLAVGLTFALQVTAIGRAPIAIAAVIFGFLNFAPAFNEFGVNFLFADTRDIARLRDIVGALEFVFVVALVFVVRRSSQVHLHVHRRTEVKMGPKYNITDSQIGAVGDHAVATQFEQVWTANSMQIDLPVLASELAELRSRLAAQAHEPSHFIAISELAMAEQAAIAGNGAVALEKLKKAGQWTWDTATKIGIGVATAAARQALGI